jgi:hypothetical protein
VQIKGDGTRVILPANELGLGATDRVGLPVMLLTQTDGSVHRDGFPAAVVQQHFAVAECGRLHGAPDSLLSQGGALARGSGGLVVAREAVDNA